MCVGGEWGGERKGLGVSCASVLGCGEQGNFGIFKVLCLCC